MRRFRLLLALAAVVYVGRYGVTRPAMAQEGGDTPAAEAEGEHAFVDHAAEECAKLLNEGKKVEDCQKAPNPLLPEKNEIIWGVVGFAIVFGFIAKVGLPAIKSGMNARTERIKGDLDAAEAQRTEAQTILDEYKAQLADARNESGRIIEEARQAADEVKRSLTARAEADIAEMRARATADIESAKVQAIADLRGEVANLAIGAAEQVVERNLDRDTNVALVESFINQVGANN
jgi:F-type H+-transporting ATPase subunit b